MKLSNILNEEIKRTTLEITVPFVRDFADRMEIKALAELLTSLTGKHVKSFEIVEHGDYRAVFFIGMKPTRTEIKELVDSL